MAPTIHSILGLPQSATRAQVNKAYRKAAKALHPDRGGSNEAMAAVSQYIGLVQLRTVH